MRYELFYWPSIQGRGEFVRLALETAGAVYVDVARESGRGHGVEAMIRLMEAPDLVRQPFAPPFPPGGQAGDRTDRKHTLLPGPAPGAGARGRGDPAMGASAAAYRGGLRR